MNTTVKLNLSEDEEFRAVVRKMVVDHVGYVLRNELRQIVEEKVNRFLVNYNVTDTLESMVKNYVYKMINPDSKEFNDYISGILKEYLLENSQLVLKNN